MQAKKGMTFTVDYNEIYMQGYIAAQSESVLPRDCPYVTIPLIRAWTEGFKAAKDMQIACKSNERGQ